MQIGKISILPGLDHQILRRARPVGMGLGAMFGQRMKEQMSKLVKFIWFDAICGPKPYKFIGFGDIYGPRPYKFIGLGDIGARFGRILTEKMPHLELQFCFLA